MKKQLKYLKLFESEDHYVEDLRSMFNIGGSIKINDGDVKKTALYINKNLKNIAGGYKVILKRGDAIIIDSSDIIVCGVLKDAEFDGVKMNYDCLIIKNMENEHSYIFNSEKHLADYELNIFDAKPSKNPFGIPETNFIKIVKTDLHITDDDNLRHQSYVHVNNFGLSDLDGIQYLTNLKSLWVANNRLGDLKHLENITHLRFLNCERNFLRNLDDIKRLTELESLYAQNNLLTNINAVENLRSLKTLSIFKNNLTNIDVIKNLPNLYSVSAGGNNFSTNYINELKNYCANNKINLNI